MDALNYLLKRANDGTLSDIEEALALSVVEELLEVIRTLLRYRP